MEVPKLPIAERWNINGVNQAVWVRGKDPAKPLVLFLHGGPGVPLMPLYDSYFALLEDSMIQVHWDQRGTAKSFRAKVRREPLSIEQIVNDTIVLTERLLHTFDRPSLYLWGTSWGSIIGVLAVQRRPDLFRGYIGCAQNVDIAKGEEISYQFTLEQASRRNLPNAITQLSAAPPPYQNAKSTQIQRKWLMEFGGFLRTGEPIQRIYSQGFRRSSAKYGLLDVARFFRGQKFSLRKLWDEILSVNLSATVPTLDVPVWFLEGRNDFQCPSELAEQYLDQLGQPLDHLIWFEDSAHMPYIEEPEKFQQVMRSIVAHPKLTETKLPPAGIEPAHKV